MQEREHFGNGRVAVLAMAGSAIGLGNIWRFPYMVGQYGGGAFIIIYLAFTLFLSVPIFLSEAVIGRSAHSSTFGAMRTLAPGTRWKWLGFLTVLTPVVLLSYYSVVGGWSVEFLIQSVSRGFGDDASGVFSEFVSRPFAPLLCHTVFLLLTALIVRAGVKSGIELFNRISIPVLFVLIVFLAVYSISLPGAEGGVKYLLKPDFSRLTSSAVVSAMGQSFFSLSLGVGTVLTYASYMRSGESLVRTGAGTAFFDVLFAIIAGFAVMPAVFSAGIEPGAGPGLIFESLPYIFARMGATAPLLSRVASILFFLTIVIAALTSSISMFEVGVAYLVEEKRLSRGKAVFFVFGICWVLGCFCALSGGLFNAFDTLVSDYLMTFGSLLFVLFAGWMMSRQKVEEQLGAGVIGRSIRFFIKWVAPLVIVAIFISNILLK